MSASSSLSRIELALGSAESSSTNNAATTSNATSGSSSAANSVAAIKSSLGAIVPTWLSSGSSSSTSSTASNGTTGRLPSPGGSTNAGLGNAASSASALANSAAASASAAASKAGHQARELFSLVSSKVTGKEHVPSAPPAAAAAAEPNTGGDIEEGKTLLPSPSSAPTGGPLRRLASQFSEEFSALTTLSWRNRMIAFVFCALAGCMMLGLSFMYVSLIFLGSPAKFAISYALANLFLLGSSLFLVGPSKQLAQMFQPERAVVSGVYLASLLLLFYVSFAWGYFFVVLPVLAVQLVALLAYVASYVPFGQGMLTRICRWTLGRQLTFLSA